MIRYVHERRPDLASRYATLTRGRSAGRNHGLYLGTGADGWQWTTPVIL